MKLTVASLLISSLSVAHSFVFQNNGITFTSTRLLSGYLDSLSGPQQPQQTPPSYAAVPVVPPPPAAVPQQPAYQQPPPPVTAAPVVPPPAVSQPAVQPAPAHSARWACSRNSLRTARHISFMPHNYGACQRLC